MEEGTTKTWRVLITLLATILLFALATCAPSNTSTLPAPPVTPSPSAISSHSSVQTPSSSLRGVSSPTIDVRSKTPTVTPDLWKEYRNKTFAICLKYPSDWMGPEIYEYKDGFIFEVGTDKVYKYGTPIETRVYSKIDAYYITVTYSRRPADVSIDQYKENQPWLKPYLALLSLRDGESRSDQRSKFTRVRAVNIGDYSGLEYVSTVSETARTDFYYQREVFVINAQYYTFRITGNPTNVKVTNEATRKDDYKRVEETNVNTFRSLVDSISMCAP